MSGSPTGEIGFAFDGADYTLAFDWRAIAFFERESGVSFIEAFIDAQQPIPKVSLLAFMVQAGLQRHHAGIDLDTAGKMAMDDAVRRTLDLAQSAALPEAEPTAGKAPAKRKASAASTGTKRSRDRSKPG